MAVNSTGQTLLDRMVAAVERVRQRLLRAAAALEAAGVPYAVAGGNAVAAWLPQVDPAAVSDAVHVFLAGEKVRPEYASAAPTIDEAEPRDRFKVVNLPSLVLMKLTRYRRKDQVHLPDMLEVGLIDASWIYKLPPELGARLQQLIDTPEG